MTPQNDGPFQVGDTFSISTWGRLTGQGVAQHGIAALTGMVSAYHADCPVPHHFWCAPPPLPVFAMAELYQAGDAAGENYIGCYISGADFSDDGVPRIHPLPSFKALMQPLDDGRVIVHFGRATNQENSLGVLDRKTLEYFLVTPHPIPDVPYDTGNTTTFVLRRNNNFWHIAHIPQDRLPGRGMARVFARLPILSNPSPLSKIAIDNHPPRQ